MCHKTSLGFPHIEPEYMCRKYFAVHGNKNADASNIRQGCNILSLCE